MADIIQVVSVLQSSKYDKIFNRSFRDIFLNVLRYNEENNFLGSKGKVLMSSQHTSNNFINYALISELSGKFSHPCICKNIRLMERIGLLSRKKYKGDRTVYFQLKSDKRTLEKIRVLKEIFEQHWEIYYKKPFIGTIAAFFVRTSHNQSLPLPSTKEVFEDSEFLQSRWSFSTIRSAINDMSWHVKKKYVVAYYEEGNKNNYRYALTENSVDLIANLEKLYNLLTEDTEHESIKDDSTFHRVLPNSMNQDSRVLH